MMRFEGSHQEVLLVPAELAATRAHFSDLTTIAKHTDNLETFSVDGDILHFVLKLQDHGVFSFKGDYKCRYVLAGDTLTWTAAGGNTEQSGRCTFRRVPGGTELNYAETVAVEMDVNAMVGTMLKQVMGPMITHEIKGYLKRMTKALAA